MIVKNEAHNLGPLFDSIRGCFDEIHITDTGSTDGTLAFIEQVNQKASKDWPNIQVHHFEWVNDFAAARNYAFSHAKTDYVMWMDGDDVLSSAEAFIQWRDHVLHSAHYWVAVYNYSFKDGQPECKFIRERVVRRDYGFKWEYFVHEGIVQVEGRKFWPQRVSTWHIDHRRTDEDRKQDFMRNIKLMESHNLDEHHPRMKFYYGKELLENGMPEKAGKPLMEAAKSDKLDMHDRILTIQYAAQSALAMKAYDSAIDLLMNGLRIMLTRAEYWCLLGDVYVATGAIHDAVTAFKMALQCRKNDLGGALVVFDPAYDEYPRQHLANILITFGDFDGADEHIKWLEEKGHPKAREFRANLARTKDLSMIRTDLPNTADVIITCPPNGVVTDWDENTLAVKGHGGSETAAIEVAKWIKLKTGRKVKLFHPRIQREIMPSGVEYIPTSELVGYLHNVEPAVHIAWRHAVRLTNAKSYVWCHDLQCPGAEKVQNYDKIIALSGFHKQYLIETNGVPADKITLGFNGINPDDFAVPHGTKDPLKVVFSSSPDRGLVQTIEIVKKAREASKMDIKLHCFYGFENMRKGGQTEWADQIEAKIKENSDFVVYHGNVSKKVLMAHFKEAAVWIYPADFIETYCITAIEALCAGVWPIVRRMGALPYTLSKAIEAGQCDMLDPEVKDDASVGIWANALIGAIIEKKWQKVKVNPQDYSWERVAEHFIREFDL
jgi:glycosyltransferase involved in cell wall biosynthesis